MADYVDVQLDQLQPVLPWIPQTIWNMRCSSDPDKRKGVAWLRRIPGRRGLFADIELLIVYLLVRGLREVALEVLIRTHQVQIHGNVFRGQKLGCSFGDPGCSSGQCPRCMTLRFRFRSWMTPTQPGSIESSAKSVIAGLTKLREDSSAPQLPCAPRRVTTAID